MNPWSQLPSKPPYVLPEDAAILETHNARRKDEHRFRLDTLPEPFMGPLDAPVVLLNLNPGFHPSDLLNYASGPRISMMRKSLTHDLAPQRAFYFLTDTFKGTGGWGWWYKKLRPVIDRVSLEQTRRGVQVIEYVPYKSQRFHNFRSTMPSQHYSFHLAQQAVERGATIVAMRRFSDWISAVPALADASLHKLNSAQNVIISKNNCPTGFAEIVDKLRGLS